MSGETPRKHSENAGQREETTEEKCPFNTIPWSVEFPIERKRKKNKVIPRCVLRIGLIFKQKGKDESIHDRKVRV